MSSASAAALLCALRFALAPAAAIAFAGGCNSNGSGSGADAAAGSSSGSGSGSSSGSGSGSSSGSGSGSSSGSGSGSSSGSGSGSSSGSGSGSSSGSGSGSSSGSGSGSSSGSSGSSGGGTGDGGVTDAATTSDAGLDATLDGSSSSDGGDGGPATDLNWAQWPMPNSPAEVAAGAPNAASYTDNANGTVTDDVTGLTWQQTPTGSDGGAFPEPTWAGAMAYCAGLSLAGDRDWRLPTVTEFVSILDFSLATGPMVDATSFPGTPAAPFWSSTPWTGPYAWYVDFGDGVGTSGGGLSSAYYVRCVRGGVGPFTSTPAPAPPGRYQTTGTGASATVYDTKTGLTWQQATTTADVYSEPADATYCAGLSLNGVNGRLPSVSELLTIVDYSRADSPPVIDTTAFPGTPGANYWSSTPVAGASGFWWEVTFSTGVAGYGGTLAYVRCVR